MATSLHWVLKIVIFIETILLPGELLEILIHTLLIHEVMVKIVKTSIKKAIGDKILTPFELYTVILKIAKLVNERPIGRIPTDTCPNDILLGRATRQTMKSHHRLEFLQPIFETFWRKWRRDVLPQLVPREK